MTRVVQQMTYSLLGDQIRSLTKALIEAAETGDQAAVSRADHALRCAVIALVGGASLSEDGAQDRITILAEALDAVRRTADMLSAKAAQRAGRGRANLVYLNCDRKAGPR
ncbi:hypothetical protein [uncultured Roseovarius sp.]|uniref:hypothetical protein n=1 Tax=uncultured Roseovarius sp. TaxID=293344 RepID=UPI000C3F26D5|nr:hypothetical protein [Roseovarius sp.]MBD13007.1 hypothetical protein [Roseovarius sp.]|tara:strand:- start:549 stop:878 length:330 start_codon:yes stop_codon:yes gene_type:complete